MNVKQKKMLLTMPSIILMSVTWWLVFYNLCHMPKAFCLATVAFVILSAFSKAIVPAEMKRPKDILISAIWALVWFPWLCYELLLRHGVLRNAMAISVFCCMVLSTNAAVKIDRIEPTDWYVGMKNTSLQLMIYGKDVRNANVTTDYSGVAIDSVVRLDSPNYLLVYLNMAEAKAGEMVLKIDGKRVRYQLKHREKRGEERIGFTCADVLYQLMPDRFASGMVENDQLITMNPYQCDRSNPNLRHGGDLEGIRQHLDYFNELGVTALWFTPVLENNSPDRDGSSTCIQRQLLCPAAVYADVRQS